MPGELPGTERLSISLQHGHFARIDTVAVLDPVQIRPARGAITESGPSVPSNDTPRGTDASMNPVTSRTVKDTPGGGNGCFFLDSAKCVRMIFPNSRMGGADMDKNSTRLRYYSIFVSFVLTIGNTTVCAASEHPRLPSLELPSELELAEDHVFGLESEDGTFGRIADVAVDSKNNIFVLDGGFFRVVKFSDSGELLSTFGGQGEGPGDFRDPMAIAVGHDNRVYIGGTGSLVAVYDEDGTPITSFRRETDTFGAPVRSIAVDSRGYIYLSTIDVLHQKTIFKFSGDDYSLVQAFGRSFAMGQDVDTRAERVFGGGFVDVDPNGVLLYSQLSPPQVSIFGDDGELYETIPTRATQEEVPDIRVSAVGDSERVEFFVPWMSDKILCLDGGSFIVTTISPGDENSRPAYIDYYGPNGRLQKTAVRESPFRPVCIDTRRRLYVIENREEGGKEFPVVVRYTIGN